MPFFVVVNIQIFSISLESPSFLQNVANAKFEQRDGHGKLRNSHGKVMEKSCAKCVFTVNLVKGNECTVQ